VVARVEQSGNLPCAIAILEWILYFKGSLSLDDLKEAIEISLEDEILAFGRLAEGEFGEFLVIVPPGCHRRVWSSTHGSQWSWYFSVSGGEGISRRSSIMLWSRKAPRAMHIANLRKIRLRKRGRGSKPS
jgi:hypothetical protein